jgi:uncharacterized protein
MTTAEEMDSLIDRHIKAEIAGDSVLAASDYTDDVVHDVVGWPTGPVTGAVAARDFYEQLMTVFNTQRMDVRWARHGDEFCVVEHEATGTFPGGFAGVPDNGRPATFRMLHVFGFRGSQISHENVWLDVGSILAQLQR